MSRGDPSTPKPPKRRRLERAGFRLEADHPGGPSSKVYWRTPETGELVSEEQAEALVSDAEERTLKAAGWEPESAEGETYWRRPGSEHLYPQEAAYDVLEGASEEEL